MFLALFGSTLGHRLQLGAGFSLGLDETSVKLMVVKSSGEITGKSFPKLFTGGSKIPNFYL